MDMMLNASDHTLPRLTYLKNVNTEYTCTSIKDLSSSALKVVGDVIKSVAIKHRLLVMEKITDDCFLQTLWHQWIAFEVLSEESWWVRINSLTYLSHSQHILVGSLDWIIATMKKVKNLYNNSKINAMNTKWIWIPQVTSASQLTLNFPDISNIIKKMQNIIVEGVRGVLIFEERKHSGANLRPERSQVKIGSIRAPGDGSWFLDIAGIWHSGIYKMFLPLWPVPPLNFQNRTIRITCLQKPQVFEFKEGGKLNETKGYVSELLLITQQHLNFTEILVPTDGFGLKESNGSWNGMVGVLYRKEADIAPLDFSPSLSRTEVVEFGISIGEDLVIILSRAPSIIMKPFLLLQIFSLETLGSIVACAVALGITLGIFVKIESSFDQSFVQKLYLPQLIANCLKLFVNQGSNEWPLGNGGRIVTISGSLIVIVVGSVYSGSITAFFAIPFRSKPIDSAEDLLASKIRPALRSKTNFCQTLLAENGILYPARDRARDFSGEEIASWDFLKMVAMELML
ncbi:glutamate receptor-like isoform X2 [Macrobrachium rosenbergii]|uniref:glutamate receptor-like isoform X2 n=1 Tax=Macrobrachium rosenbergii TaxID=79674 RepID=UPI0034D5D504